MSAWLQLIPANSGGGRTPGPPGAKFYANGQLAFSASAYAGLGEPDKILVERSDAMLRIRPTTASDQGGFAVVGGGGSQYRVSLKSLSQQAESLLGELQGALEGGPPRQARQPQQHAGGQRPGPPGVAHSDAASAGAA